MKIRYILLLILFQFIFVNCTTKTLTQCNCSRNSPSFNSIYPSYQFNLRYWGIPYYDNWYFYRYPYYRYNNDIRRNSRPNRNGTNPNNNSDRYQRNREMIDSVYPYKRNLNEVVPQRREVPQNRSVAPNVQPSRRSETNNRNN
jgi:hypothetical protein